MSTPEEVTKVNELLEKQIEIIHKAADAQRELNSLKGEHIQQIDHEIQKSNNVIAGQQQTLDVLAKIKELGAEGLDITIERLHREKEELKDQGKLTEGKEKLIEQLEEMRDIGGENLEIYEQQVKALIEQEKALNKGREAAKKLGTVVSESSGRIFGVSEAWREAGVTGAILNAVDAGSSLSDSLSQVGMQMAKTFSPTNMLNSAITKVVKETVNLAIAQDDSIGHFKKLTGLGSEYEDILVDVHLRNRDLGASTEDVRMALGDLQSQFKAFTNLGTATKESLTEMATVMKGVGVETADFSKSMDLAIMSLGLAPTEAQHVAGEMVSLGKALGEPPKMMMNEFTKSIPRLAHWGRSAVDEFKKLAKASKALSMEMTSLLSIAEQFDTFESAAEKVGSLNAIMGGAYFDTMEMVNATEEERIRLLKEGVVQAGVSWDSLGRYQRKAIAAAAGINDMTEAAKVFGGTLSEYDRVMQGIEAGTMTVADLSDAARENMSISQQWRAIQEQLAVSMRPLVDVLLDIVGGINAFAKATGGAFPFIVLGTLLFVKLISLTAGAVKLAAALGMIGPAATSAGTGAATGGAAAAAGAKGFLALGAAAMGIGLGIGLAAVGLSFLADSMKGLGDQTGPFIATMILLSVIMAGFIALMVVLAPKAAAASLGIGLLAAAILGIGAGIFLAAAGMAMLMDSMVNMANEGEGVILVMTGFSLSLLAASVAALGLIFTFAVLTMGILAIGTALAFVNEDKLSALALLFAGISQIGADTSSSIDGIASSLERVAKEIDRFDEEKLNRLKEAMEIMTPAAATPAAAVATGAAGAATARIEATAYEAVAIQQAVATATATSPTAATAAATGPISAGGKVFVLNMEKSEIEVDINFDNDEVGRALMRGYLGRQMNALAND